MATTGFRALSLSATRNPIRLGPRLKNQLAWRVEDARHRLGIDSSRSKGIVDARQ